MATQSQKWLVGAALFVVCSAAVLALGIVDLPLLVGSIGILGLAAGTLLVGTADGEGGRPV